MEISTIFFNNLKKYGEISTNLSYNNFMQHIKYIVAFTGIIFHKQD